ncbi:hypothetical protein FA15DRAFT_754503 [Coprinopsis marcescibilis]|uniref:XLF-like N-terminal domain-containing protein n=1 Tax=Coprinopsis marcescibilis TaxID=230819 RepID=A0A5C3L3S0_COPMA|nr:hypothetical protein FA15DRAFT_754503 [Coprinopsis marcescibilis]
MGEPSLTEDQLKSLLSKEWLANVDFATSVPYLFKFSFSRADLSCVFILTDTKTVWTEVLSSQQFARRWRACNSSSPDPSQDEEEEERWRETSLELLSSLHTLGAITQTAAFEVHDSKFSDLAVDLECDAFKWRWEANSIGYRLSAEIISKHLIFPLIIANHLAFSSADPLSEMADNDVEKAVDKGVRSARRMFASHVKAALTKPKVATVIRRIAASLDFTTEAPPVQSVVETPDLSAREIKQPAKKPLAPLQTHLEAPSKTPVQTKTRLISESPPRVASPPKPDVKSKAAVLEGSETEDEDEEPPLRVVPKGQEPDSPGDDAPMHSPLPSPMNVPSLPPQSSRDSPSDQGSKTAKKPRLAPPSDSSDSDSNKRTGSRAPAAAKRGAKQPVRRGGKRF